MSQHRRPTDRRPGRVVIAALALLVLVVTGAAGTANAAKGGNGGGGKPGGGGGGKPVRNVDTGSFDLVVLDSADGLAHWGAKVTFDVTSTATYTFVNVDCYQGGTHVYRAGVGFYDGWPWSQDFLLKSGVWSGGAADCQARLYATEADGSNDRTLATLTFPVAA